MTMRSLPFLLIAGFVLVMAGEADAEEGGFSLEYVGSYHTEYAEGYVRDITISGNYAYVYDEYEGLLIVNIENPANPTLAGSYAEGYVRDITISGNYAYAGDSNGLVILNIEDPTKPNLVGSYYADGWVKEVTISGNYAYAVNSGGLVILNIEDPANPTLVGNYTTDYGRGLAISGNYAYVVVGPSGELIVLNIENPSNPTLAGSYGDSAGFLDVTISGNYAYIAADYNGLVILNIEDPTNPNLVGSYDTDGWPNEVAISGNYAYVSEGYNHGLVIINIEDPTNLTIAGSYDTDGDSFCVTISGNYSYVGAGSGLVILATGYTPLGVIDSIFPSPAEEGTIVFFNGTSSDSDGTIVAYQWKSSIDGELSKEEDFNRSDLSLGNHTITFAVQDNNELWNIIQESDNLWIYAIPRAIAGDDSMVKTGDTVQFSGEGADEDGNIAKYEWDFDGNGIYEWSSEENGRTTNIYNNKGTFIAVLRVTDNDGFTTTDSRVVMVNEKDEDDDDSGPTVPSISLVSSIAAIGIVALRRR